MRFPEKDEDLTGRVCVCSTGRIGVVSGRGYLLKGPGCTEKPNPPTERIDGWEGVGFDGKGTWFSSGPVVAFESVTDFHNALKTRFGGKMSFLG